MAGRESRVIVEPDDEDPELLENEEIIDESKEENKNGVVHSFSKVVRWLSDSMLGSKERKNFETLVRLLADSTMFRTCSEEYREKVARQMRPVSFKRGEVLMIQGEPQKEALIIVEGNVVRKKLVDDQLHIMGPLGYVGSEKTIGMLHLLKQEPAYATVQATSDGQAFALSSETFKELLEEDPQLAENVIQSLVIELRRLTVFQRTPLFLQTGKDIHPESSLPWFAISTAASIESFYRSGLNAILISQLSGKPTPWFPNMHIQLPSRILYINGFKGLRYLFDKNFDPRSFSHPELAGMVLSVVPGVVMTPISSILEAQNVTHMNNEPLMLRWTRGLLPRGLREVIFGVGINQLSDFFEERFDKVFSSTVARNFAGSLTAGGIAGYMSHIPHNLSTLKLMKPNVSYQQHFDGLASPWKTFLKERHGFSEASSGVLSKVATVMFPKGVVIRTAQISGSFLIINSTINALKHINVNVTLHRNDS